MPVYSALRLFVMVRDDAISSLTLCLIKRYICFFYHALTVENVLIKPRNTNADRYANVFSMLVFIRWHHDGCFNGLAQSLCQIKRIRDFSLYSQNGNFLSPIACNDICGLNFFDQ
jgi:hypothetical protein